jgi:hypothetical protein
MIDFDWRSPSLAFCSYFVVESMVKPVRIVIAVITTSTSMTVNALLDRKLKRFILLMVVLQQVYPTKQV